MGIKIKAGAVLGALFVAPLMAANVQAAGGGGVAATQVTVDTQLRANDPLHEFLSDQGPRVSAVSGDTAAVVIHKAEVVGNTVLLHGQIYIYQRTLGVWSVQAVITPSDPADSLFFGGSVALQGDTLVVGVRNDIPPVGGNVEPPNPTVARATYVYTRQGAAWTQTARLVGSDALTGTYGFGADVAISGSTIVVQASGGVRQTCATTCVTIETRPGAAYVFDQNAGAWAETAKIGVPGANGGIAAFNGDTLAVPEIEFLGKGQFIGHVAIYVRSGATWAQQATLTAADQTPAASLLATVPPLVLHGLFNPGGFIATSAIDGDTLLVPGGDRNAGVNGAIRGSVYVFRRTGTAWAQEAKIVPKSSQDNDGFGARIALSGNGAVVGGFLPKASVLARSGVTWAETQIASPGVETRRHADLFGLSLAIDNSTALITQPSTKAMVYRLTPTP